MITRVAVAGAVALAVVLLVVILMGGGARHEYSMLFDNAGQLVKGDEVQVGGKAVGTIETIELTDDNRARIGIVVEEPFAPLHEGTRGIIRATSLSGVANRYISLTPGPNNAVELDDRAVLSADTTTTIVDLDQLINTFDAPTRVDLQKVIKGFATQYEGEGETANEAARYFNPLLSTSRKLVEQLTADEQVLTDLLVNGAKVSTALAERRTDLTEAVSNTAEFADAVASQSDSLDRALTVLPLTLRRGNTTFVNLRAALGDLTTLVDASKPATEDLAPFLRELRPLVDDARPTIADLRALVDRPGVDNDLVEATELLPQVAALSGDALDNGRQALDDSQSNIAFLRPYTPDFVGLLRDFGQGAAAYDANGHYARVAPVASSFRFDEGGAGGILRAIAANDRLEFFDRGNNERCPGSAIAPLSDGSNVGTENLLPAGGCKPEQQPVDP